MSGRRSDAISSAWSDALPVRSAARLRTRRLGDETKGRPGRAAARIVSKSGLASVTGASRGPRRGVLPDRAGPRPAASGWRRALLALVERAQSGFMAFDRAVALAAAFEVQSARCSICCMKSGRGLAAAPRAALSPSVARVPLRWSEEPARPAPRASVGRASASDRPGSRRCGHR